MVRIKNTLPTSLSYGNAQGRLMILHYPRLSRLLAIAADVRNNIIV